MYYFGVHLQPLQEGHSREGVAWHVTDAVLLQISAEEKVGGAGYLCACATSNSPIEEIPGHTRHTESSALAF